MRLTLEEGGDQANDLALPASEVGAEHLAYIIYTSDPPDAPRASPSSTAVPMPSCAGPASTMPPKNGAGYWRRPRCVSTCRSTSCSAPWPKAARCTWWRTCSACRTTRAATRSAAQYRASVCAALLALGDLPGGVRTLNLAGEPRAATWCDVRGQPQVRRLVNLYGPTEDTTYSTVHELDLHAEALDEPPIGRPLPGTTVEVLDGFEGAAAAGRGRELYLGGIGLARGYSRPSRSRPPSVSRVDPGSGERQAIAPATAYACARTACHKLPRPTRRPGQVQRLPHRAGRGSPRAWRVFPRGERSLRHAHRGQRRPASAGPGYLAAPFRPRRSRR
ncbi:AMP-binding protein [Pseudomonas aeruginosa]|nr:AMP-binding protein [Pseudomonas aeruginosa]